MNWRSTLAQVWTLASKDFSVWNSYRSQVFVALVGLAFGLFSWAILGRYSDQLVPEYNTNYLSFLIIGILVSGFALPLVRGLQSRMNPWTFETVLLSGVRMPVFVFGSMLWQIIFQAITLVLQLPIALVLFGVLLKVNVLSTILAIAISMIMVVSLAMIDMGIVVVTKSADPILWAMIILQGIVSGMLYPVQQLNVYVPGISIFSWLIPFTWMYHLTRLAVLSNGSLLDPAVGLSFLEGGIYCAILVPISFLVLRWGLRRAKRDGTLGWY